MTDLVPVIPLPEANTLTNALAAFRRTFAGLQESTQERHQQILDAFELFVGRKPVTPALWHDWLEYLCEKYQPATAKKMARLIKSFFRFCEDQERIARTPCRGQFRMPADLVKRKPGFTPEEYEAVKSACVGVDSDVKYALLLGGYWAGLSIIDIARLQRAAVDLERGQIDLIRGKMANRSGGECAIPIPPQGEWRNLLETALARTEYLPPPYMPPEPEKFVFPHMATRAQNALCQLFRQTCKKAGVSKTHKSLRNGFCNALANSGVNLAVACQITGHKDPSIFLTYLTPDPTAIAEAGRLAWGNLSRRVELPTRKDTQ